MEQENQLGSLQNTAAHTSREDTHTDALFHPPRRHLAHCWQGRPLGLGEGLQLIHKYCVPPHSALLPLARVSGTPLYAPSIRES